MTTKKSTAVTAPNTGAIVPSYGEGFQGAGWENTDSGDFQIPFLNLLQSNSPQVVEGTVEGAVPGMFFNSVTQELIKSPVSFVVALTKHSFVEWRPDNGGFVAEHAIDSDVVAQAKQRAENPLELKTPAGNDLVETYQMYAIVIDDQDEMKDQVVISFSRTKIKRYKQIMTRLRTFKNSNRIPLFAHRLAMSSTNEKNAAGQSYKNVQLVPAVDNDVAASLLPADSPLLEVANALREAVLEGAAKANYDSATSEGSGGRGQSEEADAVFGEE